MLGRLAHKKIKIVQVVPPVNYTTATDGAAAAVDTKGYEEALILLSMGAASSSTKLSVDIQHSNEPAANFATVPAPTITNINPRLVEMTNAAANTIQAIYLDLSVLKRYVKPVDTINANAMLYGITMVLIGPAASPDAQTLESDDTA